MPAPKHHPAGPSQLGRIVLCPGSYLLAERARREGSALDVFREEAQSGTDLHALVNPAEDLRALDLDAADLEAVERARAWVAEKTAGASSARYEERVEIVDGIFGTVDVLAAAPSQSVIILDLKFGRGQPVPEILEWQMKAYAAAFRVPVHIHVFYPREGLEYSAAFSAEETAELREDIRGIVLAAEGSEGDYSPSASACRYCPAAGICPAFDTQILAVAVRQEALPLDPRRLVQLYEAVKLVESRTDAIRDALKAAIRSGADVGYRIKEVNVRSCPSKDAILAALDTRQALAAAKFSLGDLERAIGKAKVKELWPALPTSTQERIEKI